MQLIPVIVVDLYMDWTVYIIKSDQEISLNTERSICLHNCPRIIFPSRKTFVTVTTDLIALLSNLVGVPQSLA